MIEDNRVVKLNLNPKNINPNKNSPQVNIKVEISTGKKSLNKIPIPVTPPLTIEKGTKNTPLPKLNMNVPITTKNMFEKNFKMSFLVKFLK